MQHLSVGPWTIIAIFFVFAYAWKLLSAPDETKPKRPKYRMKNGEVDPYWKQWGH